MSLLMLRGVLQASSGGRKGWSRGAVGRWGGGGLDAATTRLLFPHGWPAETRRTFVAHPSLPHRLHHDSTGPASVSAIKTTSATATSGRVLRGRLLSSLSQSSSSTSFVACSDSNVARSLRRHYHHQTIPTLFFPPPRRPAPRFRPPFSCASLPIPSTFRMASSLVEETHEWTAPKVREAFLNFFKENGHTFGTWRA
jgi:hypothetical protein